MFIVPEDWIVVCAGVEGFLEQERTRLLFSSVWENQINTL